MSKHTPGPWDNELDIDGTLRAADGAPICVLCDHNDTEANARLIAAAPELLSTLHSVEALLDSLWTATVTSAAGREQNKQLKKLALEQVRNAIAQAEGTAPKSAGSL